MATERELFPGVVAADQDVQIEGVVGRLLDFMRWLGSAHQLLFGRPLVITSARDGQHAPGSLHAAGKAFDYRTTDVSDESGRVFLSLVLWTAASYNVTVFDERNLPGAPHVHVEYHGA